MPRKTKKIAIGGSEIEAGEVRVGKMLKLLPFLGIELKDEEGREKTYRQLFEEALHEFCGLDVGKLLDLYPSEQELLWNAFVELNPFFFTKAGKIVKGLGLEQKLKPVFDSIIAGFGEDVASFLRAGMQASLTTAGAISSTPLPSGTESAESDCETRP